MLIKSKVRKKLGSTFEEIFRIESIIANVESKLLAKKDDSNPRISEIDYLKFIFIHNQNQVINVETIDTIYVV
jgi:hypothetical protein